MLLPDRLRELRKAKNLSRKRLNELSKVSVRTIQRLESPAQGNTTPRSTTVERLAKALQVDLGVLTGEVQLPQAGNAPAPEPRRVQIGAEIAPKARLAYDLIKRRYGVSATEIINMAPLFFTLLAEHSLARRREKLEEAREAIGRLDQMEDEVGYSIFGMATIVASNADMIEEDSIAKADIFGEHLLSSDVGMSVPDEPFDPAASNPFAAHLHQLADALDRRSVVDTKAGLSYGSTYGKFPDYDICPEELNDLANGSADARRALETGFVRLSDIPVELKGEDASEERAAWLEERLPDFYKGLIEGQPMTEIADFQATATPGKFRKMLASENNSGAEKEGDVQ